MADHIQIGDIAPRIQYTGDGAETAFTYPFPVFKNADIEAYEDATLKTLTADYTVSGAGNSAGGTVTFVTAPAAGVVVTIRRQIAIQRISDFNEGGDLRAKTLNDELDYQTAALQQVETEAGRGLKLDPTDASPSVILPKTADRASKHLAFDANGDPMAAVDPGGYPASAFMATVLDDIDGAGARTTLGLGTIATFAGDQNLATADTPQFAALGVGAANDQGTLHVKTGDSGAVAHTNYDDVVTEGSEHAGHSVLIPNGAYYGGYVLGNVADPDAAGMVFAGGTGELVLKTASLTALTIDNGQNAGIGQAPNPSYRLAVSGTVGGAYLAAAGVSEIAVYGAATHAIFTGHVAYMKADRAGTSAYNLITAVSSAGADTEFSVNGIGGVASDGGTAMTTPADYADAFEWSDGNPLSEDRVGVPVVLDPLVPGKVRPATGADDPLDIIGVVSGNPTVCGRTGWNRWVGKYLVDDFNRPVLNADNERILNPNYDPNLIYVPRLNRPEWDAIGLCGILPVMNGQPVHPNWKQMDVIAPGITNWLVR